MVVLAGKTYLGDVTSAVTKDPADAALRSERGTSRLHNIRRKCISRLMANQRAQVSIGLFGTTYFPLDVYLKFPFIILIIKIMEDLREKGQYSRMFTWTDAADIGTLSVRHS